MAYIGNIPADKYTSFAKQDFTVTATTSYTLDHSVSNENEIALFINFVRQEPTTAYTASGTSLTLTEATSVGDDMYCVFIGKAVQTVTPADGTVTNTMLAGSISNDKLNTIATSILGSGAVLQMVHNIQNMGNTRSSGSHGSWIDSASTALSITPSSTSSKIIIGYFNIRGHTNGSNRGSFYSIFRDINGGGYSNIGQSSYGLAESASNTGDNESTMITMLTVDEPNTTSQVNYKAYYKAYNSSGEYYFHHVGYAGGTDMPILKIAMEVAG